MGGGLIHRARFFSHAEMALPSPYVGSWLGEDPFAVSPHHQGFAHADP
jgi:hypothetical protein